MNYFYLKKIGRFVSQICLLLFFFFNCSTLANAQTPSAKSIPIAGQVNDDKNNALSGVSITIKGRTGGIVSNSEGKFALGVPDENAILVFTYIGFKSIEQRVGKTKQFQISMTPDSLNMDEVVIIGYGEVKRSDLTGSVGKVNIEELSKAPVTSFDQALAGRVAGVQVMSQDGQPGSLPNIVIRGGNSITQNNAPLYIVDGFPLDDNDNGSINTFDIKTIDILKDASATAIYGARGANGVVIITTKSGTIGAPQVSFDHFFGLQNDVNRIKLMNPYQFVKLQLELDPVYATPYYLTKENKTLEDYKNVTGIDWYDKVTQTAPMQNYSLGVRGGTNLTRYSISGSILDQKGLFINTGFNRYQGRISLDQKINDKVKLGINTNYSVTNQFGTIAADNDGHADANIMANIWGYRPFQTSSDGAFDFEEQLIDPEIDPATQYRVNPYLQLTNELRERIRQNLLINSYLDIDLVKNLKLRITGGLNQFKETVNVFNNSKTRSGSTLFPFSLGVNGSKAFNDLTTLSNENTLTYSKRFNSSHKFDALVGHTQQIKKSSYYSISASKMPNEELGLGGLDQGIPREIDSRVSQWVLQSVFGRINYDFNSKLLLTATIRADGSSKFLKGNRWGMFPSAALAYRLSEEKFLKNSKVISDVKLRTSYGITGNNRVGDFSYLSLVDITLDQGYSFGNAIPTQGAIINNTVGNADLKWETTKQFDAGIDLSFWKDRLTLTADYYHKRTNDLLLLAQLPYSSGYVNSYKNIGAVSNQGFELSISSQNIVRSQFNWSTSFNIAFNKNKVLSLAENQKQIPSSILITGTTNSTVYLAKIGEPVAQFYGLIANGVYIPEDFNTSSTGTLVLKDGIPANGGVRAQIRPGDAKYQDLNNDGLIDVNDYTTIGNPNPDFYGGLNNEFRYKNFDLSVFLQYSYGNQIFNANKVRFENGRAIQRNTNQFASLEDRWTPENPTSDMPALNRLGANFYSTRSVEDGSFLRLKTVSLGYDIPLKKISNVKITRLRVSFAAQNLLTWTKYSGIDPEVSTRYSPLTPGFDLSPYPRAKTYVFSINAKF